MLKITQLSWDWYLRLLTTSHGLEKAPKVQDERCSGLVAAQRGQNAGKGHSREAECGRVAGLRDAAPPGLSVRAMGGCEPLIARQPEWPALAAVPMERIAAHKRPEAFLGWRKGLCYLAQEASVRAAPRWES